ncbi:MAG: extracellular solute-binding protein [Candidatus Latescibacteria bacterium]|nr:extracellular solute-binding protein [Candidatus Latescibacterota bacterium]
MRALFLFLFAASLSLPDGGGAEPVKVVVWDFGGVPGHQAWIKQAVRNFNSSRQDIQIELEIRDWATQRESLISTTIVGEGPDIIRVHHKYSVEFGQLGGLYALESFPDFPQVAERFFPNVLEQVEYQGKHYGLPITMLPFILAVNQSILDKYQLQIPRTWEEMKAMGPVLKERGIHTFTMPGGVNLDTAYRFLPLLYKAGGRVFDQGWTRATFNGPAGLAALNFLMEMKQAGFFPSASAAYAFDDNAAHWCTEKAALSIEGPWWQDVVLGNYKFDTAKLVLAPVPGPAQPVEPNPPRTLLDVVMVAITGYTRVPQQAWTVLKALNVEDPVWGVPDPAMGGIPAHQAAYAPGVQSKYIGLEVLAQAGRNGLGWPGHPGITEIQRTIADAVNMALTGTLSPQEALDAAAEEVDEILNDY